MMETRFIDGGEYVDRQAYIEVRDENSRLRERIAQLEEATKTVSAYSRRQERKVESLQARLDAVEAAYKDIHWASSDKDNMEFTATITCWQHDKIKALEQKE